MRIKAYFLLAYNSLIQETTYVSNTIAQVIRSFGALFLQIFAWRALYASVDFAPVMGRSFDAMITYVLVVSIVSTFTDGGGVAEITEERMKSGEIALDLFRPLSPRGIIVAECWGQKMIRMIIVLITFALCLPLVGGIAPPLSPIYFLLFLMAIFFGYLINLMFDFLMATFAFWFVNVHILSWFVMLFVMATSGAIVPLWLLPDWLRALASALPFQAIIYIPMQIYLGDMVLSDVFRAMGVQLLWIAGLGLVQQVLWKRGERRIVVHGG